MDVVVVAKMKKFSQKKEGQSYAELPASEFEVISLLKGEQWAKVGDPIKIHYFGKNNLPFYLIMGTDTPDTVWTSPLSLDQRGLDYVRKVVELPKGPERLKFFLNHLEDKDEMLARDAYDEFARAPYDDVIALKPSMDREKVIEWVKDVKNVSSSRRRLYLTLLGVCGKPEDADMLETFMKSKKREDKQGLDAMVACYLTLKGEPGMKTVKELFLSNPKAEYQDTYSSIMAMRFHGAETEVIAKEKLLEGFRCILDREDLADLVIPDLARWEDWTVLDRLEKLYAKADPESNWVRVPIINYVRACPLPEAKVVMENLKKIDPDSVKRASSFFPFAPKKQDTESEQPAAGATSLNAPLSAPIVPLDIEGDFENDSMDQWAGSDSLSPTEPSADPENFDRLRWPLLAGLFLTAAAAMVIRSRKSSF